MEQLDSLAAAAADGDQNALTALLEESRPLVMAQCRKFLPNPLDAEEACQDVLVAIARNIEGFEGRSKFTTWIYPICTNTSIDCYRKLKRRQSVVMEPVDTPAGGSTPSVVAGARIDILEATEQFDREVVDIVLMRDLLDMDYGDMASMYSVEEATMRWRVAEGRKKLRRVLADR